MFHNSLPLFLGNVVNLRNLRNFKNFKNFKNFENEKDPSFKIQDNTKYDFNLEHLYGKHRPEENLYKGNSSKNSNQIYKSYDEPLQNISKFNPQYNISPYFSVSTQGLSPLLANQYIGVNSGNNENLFNSITMVQESPSLSNNANALRGLSMKPYEHIRRKTNISKFLLPKDSFQHKYPMEAKEEEISKFKKEKKILNLGLNRRGNINNMNLPKNKINSKFEYNTNTHDFNNIQSYKSDQIVNENVFNTRIHPNSLEKIISESLRKTPLIKFSYPNREEWRDKNDQMKEKSQMIQQLKGNVQLRRPNQTCKTHLINKKINREKEQEKVNEKEENELEKMKEVRKHLYWKNIVKPNYYPKASNLKKIELELSNFNKKSFSHKLNLIQVSSLLDGFV